MSHNNHMMYTGKRTKLGIDSMINRDKVNIEQCNTHCGH